MCTVVSSDSSSPENRLAAWRRAMSAIFGMDMEVLSPAEAFSATARVHALGPVRVLQLDGDEFAMRCVMRGEDGDFLVVVPVAGSCRVEIDSGETFMDDTAIYVVPTNGEAAFRFDDGFRFVAVTVQRNLVPSLRRMPNEIREIARTSDSAGLFANILAAVSANHDDLSARTTAKVIDTVLDLLEDALRDRSAARTRSNREWLHRERITSVVERELRNPALDIAFIARCVGLSVRHVHRLFADDAVPIMQWVLELRLENCYRELVQEGPCGRTIGEIAYSWGFNDQAHFSRAFRRRFGITPSGLRAAPAAGPSIAG